MQDVPGLLGSAPGDLEGGTPLRVLGGGGEVFQLVEDDDEALALLVVHADTPPGFVGSLTEMGLSGLTGRPFFK
jgi:hypothetical protein